MSARFIFMGERSAYIRRPMPQQIPWGRSARTAGTTKHRYGLQQISVCLDARTTQAKLKSINKHELVSL